MDHDGNYWKYNFVASHKAVNVIIIEDPIFRSLFDRQVLFQYDNFSPPFLMGLVGFSAYFSAQNISTENYRLSKALSFIVSYMQMGFCLELLFFSPSYLHLDNESLPEII